MSLEERRGGSAVAAIDCGSNSTRLLVADGRGRSLVRLQRITRLSEGVDASGRLSAGAIRRTTEVLCDFRKRMHSHGVERGRLVATSAVRDAENRKEFMAAASEASGFAVELLSGEVEGQTAFAGATADLAPADVDTVVVDIGGGSTEVVVGRTDAEQVVSLPLGCVRLTERYLTDDPPEPGQLQRAAAFVREQLVSGGGIDLSALAGRCRLVGVAGTVSTLAMLEHGMATYDRDLVHHVSLAGERVDHWYQALATEPASARARRPGMHPGRQDVIVAGVLVLREVMHQLRAATCLVSESDILDGLVASLL